MTSGFDRALNRRRVITAATALGGLGLAGVSGCATASGSAAKPLRTSTGSDPVPPLAPIRAQADRLFDLTCCLRPFRAAGPRLDVERLGDTLVVHNYGHGGSGWSLSWGSSTLAVQKAMASSPREVAVLGCGALGLTSALLAQKAGASVTIYARDQLPQTRSARATGSWTPDSRIALTQAAGPAFGDLWEKMARTSFKTYRQFLGLPGTPMEWIDTYMLSDDPPETTRARALALNTMGFAEYHERISDLTPKREHFAPGETPFPTRYVSRASNMMFNLADYGHTLMSDFYAAGGKFVRTEFQSPSDIGALKERVVINCPGYGARALWKDESVIPVRGQISWLIPQPELNYGLYYNNVSILPRRDGIVVQAVEGGDLKGFKDDREIPDRSEGENAVAVIAGLYARMAAQTRA